MFCENSKSRSVFLEVCVSVRPRHTMPSKDSHIVLSGLAPTSGVDHDLGNLVTVYVDSREASTALQVIQGNGGANVPDQLC